MIVFHRFSEKIFILVCIEWDESVFILIFMWFSAFNRFLCNRDSILYFIIPNFLQTIKKLFELDSILINTEFQFESSKFIKQFILNKNTFQWQNIKRYE